MGYVANEKDMVVGIDLGTTYSVVAYVNEFGQPQIIPNCDNERTTPSAVYIEGTCALVGSIAKEQAGLRAESTVQFIKPFVGRRTKRFEVGNQNWSCEELSAIILRKLVLDAERSFGGERRITHAVITVPAYFTEQQRKSTIDAARIAGLEVLGIINEPTAAAIAYGIGSSAEGKTVVVYDLGGGTFDVTAMRIENGQIIMLATDGDVQLGGKDWDERIIDIAAEQIMDRCDENILENSATLAALYPLVEQAKMRLTKLPSTQIAVPIDGTQEVVTVTREEFEEATEDLLAQTETTFSLVMEEACLELDQIDEVLLVGGSTRMPAVREMIKELTGVEPRQLLHPDESVAQGAAIYALMRQLRAKEAGVEVPPIMVQEDHLSRYRLLQEKLINAHTLGLVALNEKREPIVASVIPRRSYVPRNEVRRFTTSRLGQTQVRLQIMEGESTSPDGCAELGACMVSGLPEDLPQGTPIEVAFDFTLDGKLEVTAKLPTLGESVRSEINRNAGLSDDELATACARISQLQIQ